jgi:hypothetical protein
MLYHNSLQKPSASKSGPRLMLEGLQAKPRKIADLGLGGI